MPTHNKSIATDFKNINVFHDASDDQTLRSSLTPNRITRIR